MKSDANIGKLYNDSDDLALCLAILRREYVNGGWDQARLLDYIYEVQQVYDQVVLLPWRSRGIWFAMAGITFLSIWEIVEFLFPDVVDYFGNWLNFAPLLGLIALGFSAWNFVAYSKLKRAQMVWLDDLKETIRNDYDYLSYTSKPSNQSQYTSIT